MLQDTLIKKRFLEYLESFITENKLNLFDKVIRERTRHITVVLEDIYQSQNASAVLRSCDCFGIQDVHIIENRYEYYVNPDVALGSTKWLNMIKYNSGDENTLACFESLRKQGYRIVATTPHKDDIMLDELDLRRKTALVFGTELEGLSNVAINHADAWVKIPMYGFTESYNISVSAAISLHHLTGKLRRSDISWQLTDAERIETRLQWARSVVKHADKHERAFLEKEGLG
jgi:tRNA (guanosine-2'-O-)-methyltransferase